jgi:hypothetical protein
MHEIIPHLFWIGNAGDLCRPAAIESAGIKAVIQVALAEQLPRLSRELLLAHFPIIDGSGNPRGVIAAALEMTASLIRFGVPTLVCCSAGMSRSPSIAAGALAIAKGIGPHEALQQIVHNQPHDVSPGLWEAVCAIVRIPRT